MGLGHFYRSVNLALYLQSRGHEIEFVHRPSLFWDTLTGFDFPHKALEPEHEEEQTLDMITNEVFTLFYADGMIGFGRQFIKKVKEKATVVFYQNLTGSGALADVFILPSIHQGKEFFESFPATTSVYQGLEYFTFNKEIERFRPKNIAESDRVERIGVIAGGSDPKNILLTIRELLTGTLPNGPGVTYYYGQSYMHLHQLPENRPGCEFTPYNVAGILENDILIAAFGVSTYEFMHLGMPIISVAHQESNHIASKTIAEKKHAVLDLGMIDDLTPDKLSDAVQKLISNPGLRRDLSENGKKCVDLNGVQRVAKIIENA